MSGGEGGVEELLADPVLVLEHLHGTEGGVSGLRLPPLLQQGALPQLSCWSNRWRYLLYSSNFIHGSG